MGKTLDLYVSLCLEKGHEHREGKGRRAVKKQKQWRYWESNPGWHGFVGHFPVNPQRDVIPLDHNTLICLIRCVSCVHYCNTYTAQVTALKAHLRISAIMRCGSEYNAASVTQLFPTYREYRSLTPIPGQVLRHCRRHAGSSMLDSV